MFPHVHLLDLKEAVSIEQILLSPKQANSFQFMLFKYFLADNENVFPRKCKQVLCVLLSHLSSHGKFLAGENQNKTKPYLYALKKKKIIYTHIHTLLKSIRSNLTYKVTKASCKVPLRTDNRLGWSECTLSKTKISVPSTWQVNEPVTPCIQVNPCIETEANCKKAV